MLDNALITIIRNALIAGETIAGITGTPIAQAFQPTQQGVNTVPTIYIYKIGPDKRYGFPYWSDVWDEDTQKIIHTELQQYESTFQVSTLATQNPANQNQYTASDIANLCAAILQSQVTVASLQTQGVGIERITNVRNPYFLDDRARFEASPNFDFTVTHKQIITTNTPVLQSEEFQIFSI